MIFQLKAYVLGDHTDSTRFGIICHAVLGEKLGHMLQKQR